ncbi:MAG TPA: SRPBCC domain-containing protein [Candidatus Xenobia bacterium]|nr:SRPBCC domain-containing protein [Candidatus Xenobia bacterium]
MKRDLSFEAFYPHPPEKVWRALTDREAIQQWLMENTFEPRVGHKFQFRAKPQPGWSGIVDCEVLEFDPPRRLSYTWKNESLDTKVTWILEPAPGGTRVRLEHTGFKGFKPVLISFMLGGGWKGIVHKHLPAVIARLG